MRRKKLLLRRGLAFLLAALIVFTGLPQVKAFAAEDETDQVTETQIEESQGDEEIPPAEEQQEPETPAEETTAPPETEPDGDGKATLPEEVQADDENDAEKEAPDETSADPDSEEQGTTEEEVTSEDASPGDQDLDGTYPEDQMDQEEENTEAPAEDETVPPIILDSKTYELKDEKGNAVPDGKLTVFTRSAELHTFEETDITIDVKDSAADFGSIIWPGSDGGNYLLNRESCFVYPVPNLQQIQRERGPEL